jgi:hypothetical protein
MATFLQILSTKLKVPVEPQIISLGTNSATPTTINTVVTLGSYSSPSLTSYDLIDTNYIFTINNASGASKNFTVTFNYGTAKTGTFTVANGVTATLLVSVRMTKTTAGYITTIVMTDGTTTVRHSLVLALTAVNKLTYTVSNDAATTSTTIAGLGGSVVLDRLM